VTERRGNGEWWQRSVDGCEASTLAGAQRLAFVLSACSHGHATARGRAFSRKNEGVERQPIAQRQNQVNDNIRGKAWTRGR